jgi:hypothetical protein
LLTDYVSEARQEVEAEIVEGLFAAIGKPSPLRRPGGQAKRALRTCLETLLSTLGDEVPEGVVRVHAEDFPSAPEAPIHAPGLSVDEAAIRALAAEIDSLSASEHPLRLVPLLQALTAEVRMWLEQLPSHGPLHYLMSDRIPTLSRIKRQANVEEFIKGLARDHRADWASVASSARARVRRFDSDATESVLVRKEPAPPKERESASEKVSASWPEFPKLRGLDKPIFLVGGLSKEDKIEQIYERYGVRVEWYEIDSSAPRQTGSFLDRVRSGTVGAVVLLEGLVSHAVSGEVRGVCATEGVPFAHGDRAGTGDVRRAFEAIEARLSG